MKYVRMNGETVLSNQYSATHHHKAINLVRASRGEEQGLPGNLQYPLNTLKIFTSKSFTGGSTEPLLNSYKLVPHQECLWDYRAFVQLLF